MTKIMFVCLGNICRSPMAEFILKDMVKKAGISEQFQIESAGTYYAGRPIHPPAKAKLAEHGIISGDRFSRQLKKSDYDRFDLIIGMDNMNLVTMSHIFEGDPESKLHLLLDYTERPGNVDDPWYTGDFDTAWIDIEEGCRGLLKALTDGGKH